jgi:GT2 family glycosyltransferase
VWVIIPTYRRGGPLRDALAALAAQDHQPAAVVVVDNEPAASVRELTEEMIERGLRCVYLAPGENLGPAGAMALATEHLLGLAGDDDWVLRVDDDRPLPSSSRIGELLGHAEAARANDPTTGGVGLTGSRIDLRRGVRFEKPPQVPGQLLQPVDYLATGQQAMYAVRAIRAAGTFDGALFFGWTEVEYGLRLRDHGFSLYRLDSYVKPRPTPPRTFALERADWRRYYTVRNQVHVLRRRGHPLQAARVAIVRGIGKPVANLVTSPRTAWPALRLGVRAARDGWQGRLGRRVDPASYMGGGELERT